MAKNIGVQAFENKLAEYLKIILPSGSVTAFAGSIAPSDWLICDGSAVSRTVYADLFAAIGIAHGQGDGSTTFHLPDYRGRFLRGVDGGAGNDPDKASRTAANAGGNSGDAVGSVQADQFGSHNHNIRTFSGAGGANAVYIGGQNATGTDIVLPNGGNETRPKNANVNYIIKV